ncbi:helix-turn-helix domain-containing protein [Chryseobacterium sp. KCF3-3]|uniref:helix-turn-helix domain-containing protein n=1 Tax=Chryseobacterium sp. KCF3-3 TaxID=3231511 RepID=UPI0038B362D0
MEIHKVVKRIRENKKISQEYIAFELKLNQSQYSRREKGDIPFSAIEIEKIACILEVKVSELYDDEQLIGAAGEKNLREQNEFSYRLIEKYEKIIEEKQLIISLLRECIEGFVKHKP